MSEIRVLPLPKVTGIWRHDSSKYPEIIKVPMSDGRIITYHIDIEMPHPQCMEAVELIRMWNDNTYGGYKYKGDEKHEKIR